VRATVADGDIHIIGGFATLDGTDAAVETATGRVEECIALAEALSKRLVDRRASRPGAPRVLVTRAAQDSVKLSGRLAEHGIAAICVPTIEIEVLRDAVDLQAGVRNLPSFNWVIVSSANGARAARAAADRVGVDLATGRWAAIGRATARALREAGVNETWMPHVATAAALAEEIPVESGDSVLWIHGDLADQSLAHRLRARGASVTRAAGYRTVVGPQASRALLEQALADGPLAALTFASPSAIDGLLQLAPPPAREALLTIPVASVGARTTAAAQAAGFREVVEAPNPDAGVLAEVATGLALRTRMEATAR
jgi:uroporphyrinogen-III synthase